MSDTTDNHTPHRPIRIDKTLWDAFGTAAGKRQRANVVREFIRWYVGLPGARLPHRPD